MMIPKKTNENDFIEVGIIKKWVNQNRKDD